MAVMRSTGMQSSSAAISAIEILDPPMSGLPVRTTAEPSALTLTTALDCMPTLNQNPDATPRPWFSPSGAL